jgi:hypothetical protein
MNFISSQQSYSMRENIVSLLAWILTYVILIIIVVMGYLIIFEAPGLTGFFLSSVNQVNGVPVVGWQLPTLVLIAGSFTFSQDPNEMYILPLCALNLSVLACNLICLITTGSALTTCVLSPNVACTFITAMLLVMAFVLIFIIFIVAFLLLIAFIRYSVCIRDNVDYVIAAAKAQRESERMRSDPDGFDTNRGTKADTMDNDEGDDVHNNDEEMQEYTS